MNETEILTADFCFNENLNSGAQMAVEKKRRKRNSMTTYCKATHSSPWIRVISKCFPLLLYIANSSIVPGSVMRLRNSFYMNQAIFKLPLQIKISMQLQFFMVSGVCYKGSFNSIHIVILFYVNLCYVMLCYFMLC